MDAGPLRCASRAASIELRGARTAAVSASGCHGRASPFVPSRGTHRNAWASRWNRASAGAAQWANVRHALSTGRCSAVPGAGRLAWPAMPPSPPKRALRTVARASEVLCGSNRSPDQPAAWFRHLNAERKRCLNCRSVGDCRRPAAHNVRGQRPVCRFGRMRRWAAPDPSRSLPLDSSRPRALHSSICCPKCPKRAQNPPYNAKGCARTTHAPTRPAGQPRRALFVGSTRFGARVGPSPVASAVGPTPWRATEGAGSPANPP